MLQDTPQVTPPGSSPGTPPGASTDSSLGSPPRLAPGSRHPIPVRKPEFPFDASIPRHWLGGNALATQFFNGLNLVFPDGERFFIRSVKDHMADLPADSPLRDQVRGFFGQEAHHTREHERYFDTLRAQGYRIDGFLGRFERFGEWCNRWLPRGLRLAMTAGAEHWTATFGAMALEDRFLLQEAHPTMRNLVLWHASEEIEHKAVAFDVFQECNGRWSVRVLGFAIATVALFAWTIAGTRMLLRQDRIRREELARCRAQLRELDGGEAPRRVLASAWAYLKPGFHPNQTDELPLAYRRLAEFGIAS